MNSNFPLERRVIPLDVSHTLLLLLLQAGLALLLVFEQYVAFGVVIGALTGIPFLLNRFPHSLILFPIFLYLPFDLSESLEVQFSKIGLVIVLLSGLGAVLLNRRNEPLVFPAKKAILLILAAECLSVVNARYPATSMVLIAKHMLAFVAVYWLTVNFLHRIEDVRHILIGCVIGGVCAAVTGIARFSLGIETRVFGLHGGGYGAFIGTAMITAISIIFYGRRSMINHALLGALPLLALALFLSQTRAWTFGALCGLLFVIYIHRGAFTKLKVLLSLAPLAAVILWIVQSNLFGIVSTGSLEYATERAFQTGFVSSDDLGKSVSLLLRPIIWWHGFEAYTQFPLLGVGVGNLRFRHMLYGYPGPADDEDMGFVDNHYLNILYETGIPGVIGWTWLLLLLYRECRTLLRLAEDREETGIIYALTGSLILWGIGGMFWVLNNAFESIALQGLLIGLVFAMGRILRDRQATGRGAGG